MSTKTVSDLYQRSWSVRRNIAWTLPATEQEADPDFEHDIDGGQGSAVFILSALVIFWLILVVGWWSAQVHIPWYYWLFVVVSIAFFPFRWVLRRQREIVVETAGDYQQAAEKWMGVIRGGVRSREEVRIIERQLRTQGTPKHADSPLRKDTQLEAAEERRLSPEKQASE